MRELTIDLHTHTNISDGSDSPAELVEKARAAGLSAIALTDHDTLGGLAEAREAGEKFGVEVIPGVELAVQGSSTWDGGGGLVGIGGEEELHILGFYVPEDDKNVNNLLREARDNRDTRNRLTIEKLQELGLDVTIQDVDDALRDIAPKGMSIGRPHMAYMLFKKGYVTSLRQAFELYLGDGRAAYVPRKLADPKTGIETLAGAGITVGFAHPCLRKAIAADRLDDMVSDFKAYGMRAIEVYHSSYDEEDVRLCLTLAVRHSLLVTGGSDYHGNGKPGINLGTGKGNLRIPMRLLDELKNARKKAGLWI